MKAGMTSARIRESVTPPPSGCVIFMPACLVNFVQYSWQMSGYCCLAAPRSTPPPPPLPLLSVVCNAIPGCSRAPPLRRLTFPLIHSEGPEGDLHCAAVCSRWPTSTRESHGCDSADRTGASSLSAARFIHWNLDRIQIQDLDPSGPDRCSVAQKHSGNALSLAASPCSDVTLVIWHFSSDSWWTRASRGLVPWSAGRSQLLGHRRR